MNKKITTFLLIIIVLIIVLSMIAFYVPARPITGFEGLKEEQQALMEIEELLK